MREANGGERRGLRCTSEEWNDGGKGEQREGGRRASGLIAQQWHVKLYGFDASTQIAEDLFLYESVRPGRDHVLIEVLFPK
jgi:hypothetical protein